MKKMMSSDVVPSGNTYVKSQSNVESSTITINGVTFRFRLIHLMKERDGIRIPHLVKQIFCSPACSLQLLQENASLMETVDGRDNKVLTQFLADCKKFGDQRQPAKIMRYENEIDVEESSGKNKFLIKVWFMNQNKEKFLYQFTYMHGEQFGTYKLTPIQEDTGVKETREEGADVPMQDSGVKETREEKVV
jgi:hypothetical protein